MNDTWFKAIFALVLFGILLPAFLYEKVRAKKPQPVKVQEGLVRMSCDCGADTPCPQGRNARGGNPYRCTIWVDSSERHRRA